MKNAITYFSFANFSFRIVTVIFFLLQFSFLSLAAEDYQAYFSQGDEAYSKGDFNQAIKLYEKVLETNPNFAPAYNALGKVYQEQGGNDVEAVAWYFKSAVDIDPQYIEAYENLGKLYQQANQIDQAQKYFQKVLSLDQNSVSTQYALGWLYLTGKSQPDQAVSYFKNVVEKTQLPMAYLGLGLSYSKLGDPAMVLEIVTQLKAMGQNELASQLENAIREPWTPTPQQIQVPVAKTSSEIIKSQVAGPESALPSPQTVTPIRLRGKMINLEQTPKPKLD